MKSAVELVRVMGTTRVVHDWLVALIGGLHAVDGAYTVGLVGALLEVTWKLIACVG